MKPAGAGGARPWGRTVALHSLGWLAAANLVGVWLGVSLLWPGAGDALAPLTFGRWVPLHLDWQLYGWCALPLVGALCAWYFDGRHPRARTHTRVALGLWSLALGLGGASWLAGNVSGKLFLDWHGWTRPLLPLAMQVLWLLLVAHTAGRWREISAGARGSRVALLAVLGVVPAVLFWAAGRANYPAVNPDSGGATGASLLGSTLGIVTIYLLLPALLGLEARKPARWLLGLLAGSWLAYALVRHGHASHHDGAQIAALAVLLVWIPLLPLGWRNHVWPEAARPWLGAAALWWALLVGSGWVAFLPGFSERFKFTHELVAHAHLAMAGLVTGVNGAIVVTLAGRAAPRGVFALWQAGSVGLIAAMVALGWNETENAAELFRSAGGTQAWLAVRLAGGAVMMAASAWWLVDFVRARRSGGSEETEGEGAERRGRKGRGEGRAAERRGRRHFDGDRRGWWTWVRVYAAGVGAMDFVTGIGLMMAPELTLRAMGVAVPGGEALGFVRFVGVFVAAVGASYGVALAQRRAEALRAVFRFTLGVRAAVGIFTGARVLGGDLERGWLLVTATDLGCALVQAWLLRKEWGENA